MPHMTFALNVSRVKVSPVIVDLTGEDRVGHMTLAAGRRTDTCVFKFFVFLQVTGWFVA